MNNMTINNKTFIKNQRIAVLPWGDLWAMSDKEVKIELQGATGLNAESLSVVANWACMNAPSATFDFPECDRERALLGAIRWGYVVINVCK
jgi:hypothetical protein